MSPKSLPAPGASPPRCPAKSGFRILDSDSLIDEELYVRSDLGRYAPVRIGDVYRARYQVIGKLGFGSTSTSWLCRDLVEHAYVTLKIYVCQHDEAKDEIDFLEDLQLHRSGSSHPGAMMIRSYMGTFSMIGPRGTHECVVQEALGASLSEIRLLSGGKLDEHIVRFAVGGVVMALDYLHREVRLVHTDLREQNIMTRMPSDMYFRQFEEDERDHPCARKIPVGGGPIVYASRLVDWGRLPGAAVLCGFDNVRHRGLEYRADAMPDVLRAPEIILGTGWNEKIDVWGVAVLTWTLFEGKSLFGERRRSRAWSNEEHLARMISLLGPPPLDLLRRGAFSHRYFNQQGAFTVDVKVPFTSLEDEEENLGGEKRAMFLLFMRRMLRWRPEDRPSATELSRDPWLRWTRSCSTESRAHEASLVHGIKKEQESVVHIKKKEES